MIVKGDIRIGFRFKTNGNTKFNYKVVKTNDENIIFESYVKPECEWEFPIDSGKKEFTESIDSFLYNLNSKNYKSLTKEMRDESIRKLLEN